MIDLGPIKARYDAATPAPWDAKAYRVYATPIDGAERIIAACWRPWGPVTGPRSIEADAEFIAAARSDVPALVAEVEQLRELADFARLLGPARMVLDRAAALLVGTDFEAVQQECADMAQRIVDLIGHPVTDEPPHALVERDELRLEVEQLREDLLTANEASLVLLSSTAKLTADRDSWRRMYGIAKARADAAEQKVVEHG